MLLKMRLNKYLLARHNNDFWSEAELRVRTYIQRMGAPMQVVI
jgi:hypothetical protein